MVDARSSSGGGYGRFASGARVVAVVQRSGRGPE